MIKIEFTIGDPSGDGHEKSDSFIVQSNLEVNKLQIIHQSAKQKLGFDIRDIAGEYGEHTIKPVIFAKLISLNIIKEEDDIYLDLLAAYEEYKAEVDDSLEGEELDLSQTEHIQIIYDCMRYRYLDSLDPEVVLYIWLDILKYLEPTFEYKVEENTMPTMSCHIGYGLYH